jgi:carbon-monoxide dehydrogenase small subunit
MTHQRSDLTTGQGKDSTPMSDGGWPGQDAAQTYSLQVNGRERVVDGAWLGESLLYVLRERLGLPGSKNACEQGECGACSVLMDDVLVCSCCVLAADAVDSQIATVESVATGKELSDVQRALLDDGGVQCGFCTPGIVMAVHDLLAHNPRPDDLEVREALSGNLCRCTGYGRVFAAVRTVVESRSRG